MKLFHTKLFLIMIPVNCLHITINVNNNMLFLRIGLILIDVCQSHKFIFHYGINIFSFTLISLHRKWF